MTTPQDYATCTECGWRGLARRDGTMRRHRRACGYGDKQNPDAPVCIGSGSRGAPDLAPIIASGDEYWPTPGGMDV